MRPFVFFLITSFIVTSVSLADSVSGADLTSREKRMIDTVNATVRKAGASFKAGKFDEAAASIRRAMKQIEVSIGAGSPELYDAMVPAMKRVKTAHAMLQLEGVSIPPFRQPERPTAPTQPMVQEDVGSDSDTSKSPAPFEAVGISFTKHVAPILVNRCGRCHVSDSKGQFSMTSFAALMKGPPEGVVIFPGDIIGSRLIETIKTGDMPRGGGKVTAEELKTLETWIVGGARFDGSDPAAPLGDGTAPAPTRRNQPEVKMATGKETVSFAGDVAPLLVKNCSGCHLDAMQTRGGLRMDTFTQLLRGGDSGEVVVPGKGGESLLVKKLRGMGEGERMPAGGRAALSDDAIALISTWIDDGSDA